MYRRNKQMQREVSCANSACWNRQHSSKNRFVICMSRGLISSRFPLTVTLTQVSHFTPTTVLLLTVKYWLSWVYSIRLGVYFSCQLHSISSLVSQSECECDKWCFFFFCLKVLGFAHIDIGSSKKSERVDQRAEVKQV